MEDKLEIELRGPLSEADTLRLRNASQAWRKVGQLERYLINFTTPDLLERKIDVRARITNGDPELVIKRGAWGSGERLETTVACKQTEFFSLLEALHVLGFRKGVGAHRIIQRYLDGDIELSIVEVPGHSRFYEAEKVVSEGGAKEATALLQTWCRRQDLEVWSSEQFLAYVDELDRTANDSIDLADEESWDTIKRRTSSQSPNPCDTD